MSPHVLVLPSWTSDPDRPLCGLFFSEQAGALQRSGANVGWVCLEQRSLRSFSLDGLKESYFQLDWSEENGVPALRMHGWHLCARTLPGALLWSKLIEWQIFRFIRRYGRPDIVHAHGALWAGYAASSVFRNTGIPYVVTEHSTAFPFHSVPEAFVPYARRAFAGAARVLAVGEGLKRCLGEYAPGKNIEVVPNIVNTDFFTLPPAPRSDSPFIFLSVANLVPQKGMKTLLRAFEKAFGRRWDVRLNIAGDGPERSALQALCDELRISDRVAFLGSLSRQGVRAALWAANAFALASVVETFGVVFIEAMATGLPVIGTRSGGPEDFITDETGILVENGDVEGLAAALRRIRDDGVYAPEKIRNFTERRFSERVVTATLRRIYDETLRQYKGTKP
jgi:L-malate glycosyltransferase